MRSIRSYVTQCMALAAVLILFAGSTGYAQEGTAGEGKRKIRTKVAAIYPDLARRMNVTGKVKIEVVITPEGRVRGTRVLGGHPLLAQAAQDAVKEWRFVSAPEETTLLVEFIFH